MAGPRAARLVALSDEEYAEFVGLQVGEFADQMAAAGEWRRRDALDLSRKRNAWLFDGRAREVGHRFLKGVDRAGRRVAWVWEGPVPAAIPAAASARFLYQVTVEPERRGRGWGDATLAALERDLAQGGASALWLNVFRFNDAAIRLYLRRGFEVVGEFPTSLHLRKPLGGGPGRA